MQRPLGLRGDRKNHALCKGSMIAQAETISWVTAPISSTYFRGGMSSQKLLWIPKAGIPMLLVSLDDGLDQPGFYLSVS